MPKTKTLYTCQDCGQTSHKWLGRCPGCNAWNTLVEQKVYNDRKNDLYVVGSSEAPASVTTLGSDGNDQRVPTGLGELDRVLGGGLVPGAAILVGGDPGVGKSTLMLQAMAGLSKSGLKTLYVSGEESMGQTRLRAERLGALSKELLVWTEIDTEKIAVVINEMRPAAVVIDSIQAVFTRGLDASPGSAVQVRESAALLISLCKGLDIPILLVGHVTKDGSIAGPKVLEHIVDTVLYFEGDRVNSYRVLRAIKNRYGSAMEIGVFEMSATGFVEVLNPSELFLSDRPEGASGSCVVSSIEGTRPILVEIQSLVCPSIYGIPRRTVVGVDYNKVLVLAAVLEKKAAIRLSDKDIFLKVAGGIKLGEPAVDLGVVVAIASNYFDKAVDAGTVVFGEVGLAGEIRATSHVDQRLREADKLGFKRCVLPADNLKEAGFKGGAIELQSVSTVKEAIGEIFG